MQIKTFYLNDNITLVDASALAQVSIINIMQISVPPPPPPPPLYVPALHNVQRRDGVRECVRVHCTRAHVLRAPFQPLFSGRYPSSPRPPLWWASLFPPLAVYSRDVHSLKAAERVHSQFYRCSDRLTVSFPFHSLRLADRGTRAFLADFNQPPTGQLAMDPPMDGSTGDVLPIVFTVRRILIKSEARRAKRRTKMKTTYCVT